MPLANGSPWLTVWLLVAGLGAQERRPWNGRVLDSAGHPVAGAAVAWAATTAPHAWVAAADVLTATSGPDGSFRVLGLTGHAYAGGAVSRPGETGDVAVSPLVTTAAAGEYVTLRLGAPAAVRRVQLSGREAWRPTTVSRLRITLRHAPGLQAEVALDADGAAIVPSLPADSWLVEFLDAAGETLASADAEPTATGPVALTLPTPRPLRLSVADGHGTPVPGATIAVRTLMTRHASGDRIGASLREAWRPLGTTDAAGRLEARIATSDDWLQVFTARRRGAATAVAAFVGTTAVDARREATADAGELRFVLVDERPLSGRLLLDDKTPLAGGKVWLEATYLLPLPQGGSTQVPLLFPLVTGADGTFRADGLPDAYTTPRLLATPELPRPTGLQLPSILAEAAGRVAGLDPVVLAQLPALDLQVLRADGGPAEGAAVVVVPFTRRRWFVEPWDGQYRLDRAGRARLGVRSEQALLFCTDGVGYATQVVDETTSRLELRLEPLQRSMWTIVTADDRPAAGARLVLARYSPPIDEEDPRRQALGAIAVTLHAAWIDGKCADADGRVELRTIPDSGMRLDIAVEHAAGRLPEQRFVPGDRTLTLPGR